MYREQNDNTMLKLMYITNRPEIARIAEKAGVDRIFVDLETIGKHERQGGMDTVQSHHVLADVLAIRHVLTTSELLVRSNPIHPKSNEEIETIIQYGADIVMLPFFKTVNEVAKFIDIIAGRAKVCLLVETAEAVEKIDAILALEGINEIHIGLNDLHLAYHKNFMFELLTDGTVERLRDKILSKGIPYGFGGIARLGAGVLPSESVIKEHYRLDSTQAILSRSFCNVDKIESISEIENVFNQGVAEIRALEHEAQAHKLYFETNERFVNETISHIVNSHKAK